MVEGARPMTPDVSVIVEWDNVALAGEPRAHAALTRLAEEVRGPRRRAEVLICHDGIASPDVLLESAGLPPGWKTLRVPDSRYYELKNHGAAAAAGDIIVFIDSDVVPERGWLQGLLAPFADPRVQVVAGHAHIQADSLYSRAFALWWFFPLRAAAGPPRAATRFFANNVAFRRGTFLAHPFPSIEGTSRGACVELARDLRASGITIWQTPAAQVAHPAPRGWRHFVRRALAQGRDRLARESGWQATMAGSLVRLVRHAGGGCVNTIRRRREVGLSLAGVPAAMALCCGYYGLCFAGEAASFLRVPAVRRIRV
jgi:hypothetical protein